MVIRFSKQILNKKGVSLIYVILVLLVMTILGVAIFTLFSSNLAQVRMQEDSMKTHFINVSSIDITFAALLQDNQELLESHFRKDVSETVAPISTQIQFDDGQANVEVSSYIDSGYRYVLITSVAELDGSNFSREMKMHFRADYPEIQRFE